MELTRPSASILVLTGAVHYLIQTDNQFAMINANDQSRIGAIISGSFTVPSIPPPSSPIQRSPHFVRFTVNPDLPTTINIPLGITVISWFPSDDLYAPCSGNLFIHNEPQISDFNGDGQVSYFPDVTLFLSSYNSGDILKADYDNGTGTGTPDGGVSIEDLLYFLAKFESAS